MTIKEVSEKYDLSADTIRYYERIGLIPHVPRKENGIRDFDETACGWVEFAKCMRSAGVQVEALIDYVKLFFQEGTEEARKDILVEQLKAQQTAAVGGVLRVAAVLIVFLLGRMLIRHLMRGFRAGLERNRSIDKGAVQFLLSAIRFGILEAMKKSTRIIVPVIIIRTFQLITAGSCANGRIPEMR